jgi:flagellar assembly factor FliW
MLRSVVALATYSFEISDADTEALELQDVQDVCILSVLVIPPKNAAPVSELLETMEAKS